MIRFTGICRFVIVIVDESHKIKAAGIKKRHKHSQRLIKQSWIKQRKFANLALNKRAPQKKIPPATRKLTVAVTAEVMVSIQAPPLIPPIGGGV
jgi:hypothetical protein